MCPAKDWQEKIGPRLASCWLLNSLVTGLCWTADKNHLKVSRLAHALIRFQKEISKKGNGNVCLCFRIGLLKCVNMTSSGVRNHFPKRKTCV